MYSYYTIHSILLSNSIMWKTFVILHDCEVLITVMTDLRYYNYSIAYYLSASIHIL